MDSSSTYLKLGHKYALSLLFGFIFLPYCLSQTCDINGGGSGPVEIVFSNVWAQVVDFHEESNECDVEFSYTYVVNNPNSCNFSVLTAEMRCGGTYATLPLLPDGNPHTNTGIYSKNGVGCEGATCNLHVISNWQQSCTPTNWYNDQNCLSVTISPLLPVELSLFEASPIEKEVLLKWTTASEINNDYFEIEHSSNGRHFYPIGRVEGNLTTNDASHYQYLHSHPINGTNYYRLKQVDLDGAFEFSDVVSVKMTEERSFQVYPNPSGGRFHVIGNLDEPVHYQVINATGQAVSGGVLFSDNVIDLSGEAGGVYYIKLVAGGTVELKALVKE